MLSKTIPQSNDLRHEYLIVELKRPNVPIDAKAVEQLKSYASAVAEDRRFAGTNTKWVFVAVSSEVSPSVRRDANQPKRPAGLLAEWEDPQVEIWVKPWAQVIDAAGARLQVFRRGLAADPGADDGIRYLRKMYDKYLPPAPAGQTQSLRLTDGGASTKAASRKRSARR